MRPNKLRRHLETLHPSHMHGFFLLELYHLCKKVKKYRLMEDVVINVTKSSSIKLNVSKVIALFFLKSDKCHIK